MLTETNPAWIALTTRHQHFARGAPLALRYPARVAPIAAVERWTDASAAALAALLEPEENVYVINPGPLAGTELEETRRISCYQMYLPSGASAAAALPPQHATLALDPVRDAPDMLALTEIAFPALFRIGTPQMGPYCGVRVNGELVAMAGERLWIPGYREVSGVCTHPQHTGRGYANQLMQEVAANMQRDGDTAFLHVNTKNERAIALYRRLGYVSYSSVDWVQLKRRT